MLCMSKVWLCVHEDLSVNECGFQHILMCVYICNMCLFFVIYYQRQNDFVCDHRILGIIGLMLIFQSVLLWRMELDCCVLMQTCVCTCCIQISQCLHQRTIQMHPSKELKHYCLHQIWCPYFFIAYFAYRIVILLSLYFNIVKCLQYNKPGDLAFFFFFQRHLDS